MTRVTLVIGSTRQNRAAVKVAEWVKAQVARHSGVELEVLDLQQIALPFFDAAVSPMSQPDQSEHGLAWGQQIGQAERFIFLTPEYNRSVPAALKNALDYLYKEWNDKPAAIVSYGFVDGGRSAATHLLDILGWLKMKPTAAAVHLQLKPDLLDASGQLRDAVADFAGYNEAFATLLEELMAVEPVTV